MIPLRCTFLLLIQICTFSTKANPVPGKVTSELKQIIQEKQVADILVTFDISCSKTLEKISVQTRAMSNRAGKLKLISDALENQAVISQKGALGLLKSATSLKSRVLWITNQLSIKGASAALVDKLSSVNEVTEIDVDAVIEIIEPLDIVHDNSNNVPPRTSNSKYGQLTYGLEKIKVPEVWDLGYSGQGIVVGIVDTGADIKHDALRDSYVGTKNYGWFDPVIETEIPEDFKGHGSHCLGSIVGHNGIGVAPGAKWMACLISSGGAKYASNAVACLQHFLCPGDKMGKNRDCSKSPRVISNSWGGPALGLGPPGNAIYQAIAAFKNTGTFIVFSVGNGGPKCDTAGFPGNTVDIFSVGATNHLDQVVKFSSSGFGANQTIKPDIVAPGEDVVSSFLNNGYINYSGTSMSTPHISGVIALLLSKNPNLKNEEIWEILIKSTEPVTKSDIEGQCDSVPLDKYPNNRAGHGRINALKAINNVKLP